MDYSEALRLLKDGASLHRREWRPNKWIRMSAPEGGLTYLEIVMADGRSAPWTPSRCDQFVDDWQDAKPIIPPAT